MKVLVMSCFLATLAAAVPTEKPAPLPQPITNSDHHHHGHARNSFNIDLNSWTSGLGPATLVSFVSIAIIFFVLILVISSKLSSLHCTGKEVHIVPLFSGPHPSEILIIFIF